MASDVLTATVVPDDADHLLEVLHNGEAEVRSFAMRGLTVVWGQRAIDEVRPLLDDADPRVRLLAAQVLARKGDRTVFPILGRLLEAEDHDVQAEAASMLRATTGQRFGFASHDEDEERDVAVARWQDWIDQYAATAEILPLPADILGRFAVCIPHEDRIVILNMEGEMIEQLTDIVSPMDCQPQPAGQWLVASYRGRHVAQYDAEGNRLWEKNRHDLYDLLGPMRVRRLDNGNLLVAYLDSMKVVELAPDDTIVWQVQHNGWPADIERLENGNKLIALEDDDLVVEFDGLGNIAWQIELENKAVPMAARRLAGGKTLITLNGENRVVEMDREGNTLWAYDGLSRPMDAARLPDGSTVICDRSGVRLVNHDGQLLWLYEVRGVTRLRAY